MMGPQAAPNPGAYGRLSRWGRKRPQTPAPMAPSRRVGPQAAPNPGAYGAITMGPQAAPNPGAYGAITMGPQAAPYPGASGAYSGARGPLLPSMARRLGGVLTGGLRAAGVVGSRFLAMWR